MKPKIAVCQIMPRKSREEGRKKYREMACEAALAGADIIVFPEMWVCPYIGANFDKYKEPSGGETYTFMQELAREFQVYLFGGSIPEKADGKVYNTCYVFDREGKEIGKHRKAHLFDVDIEGGISFTESYFIAPGDKATIVNTEFGKIGLAICFDIRFSEFSMKMAVEGAKIIILPAAFNMTTGPAHWELSVRGRAMDNQVYFVGAQVARDPNCEFQAWGHSIISDPFGRVLSSAEEKETIIYGDLDMEYLEKVREELPILKSRREELY